MGNIYFTLLYQPIYNALVFVYTLMPWGGLGLAIIVITALVKAAVMPLTYKSMRAQKELQEVQPKIAEIREKYKDDKETMAKELMSVYKVHNVNPFASCLPTVVQLVVFIALYRALSAGIHTIDPTVLYGFITNPESMSPFFLGIDLSQVSIPLGIVAGVAQFFQARQMVTRRPPAAVRGSSAAMDEDMTATMNKMMLYGLPLFMLVLGVTTLQGGVTLYIIVSTVVTYAMYALFLTPKK